MLKVNSMATVDEAPGFSRMFRVGRLTLGVFFPIEAYTGDEASMHDQERLAQRAQALGYAALWVRDVPLRDPSFGDLGQIYDPWVYLGWIAAHTQTIALATGSIVLPLRHPLHVAKAAASVDRLSGGRLVLGVASGDRPVEFPAFGVDIERRAALFREYFEVIRRVLEREYPTLTSTAGVLAANADLVPKPVGRLPMLVTGNSGQPLPWIAGHADGWITYPRGIDRQAETVARWRGEVHAAKPGAFKPFVQSLYVDLADDPHLPPTPIHLGFKAGRHFLLRFLDSLRVVGVNHVILNLKYGERPASEVLEEIGTEVLPALADAQGDKPVGGELEPSDAEVNETLAPQH
ncbi:LLM class oxidoreductase [Variovorax sp. J22R115]|uniref:LLM class oxidoreductase n=1 Tax=Variovorax sp. J22R115 TaxID=3053509 RepID=UPI0025791B96|nr:LLM class oxidoreductase [Variovorax sp. J22R115]MDM0047540.1 LLM class oxidoreductase [Variovorax sp. J22R115]